ncbi:cobalt ABC transporter permease [Halarcobacter mediterraneus]|uniref:Cobalt ABC transporter permease n=1 Tax=Halarcobacter mediterraneus TaxID=2023153 RepID=A0A4Q1B063_9BACT|nr:energy-coupling factor transporter transmembrane component T [Halarcobacter mediterraneus]RXK11834.1 cobalt ABC transporter permease [Halarcobacter mediterraneus]
MIKISPTFSLLGAIFYSISLSFSTIHFLYFIPLAFVLFCQYSNIFKILKRVLILNIFIIMIFFVLLFQSTFEEALNIYLRTNMIILFNLAIFYSSSGYDIVRALDTLKFPKTIISSVYFSLKMIQILSLELKNIKMMLKARGFKANTSFFTYETYGNLFGHIFVKAIRKAQALEESFSLRNFNGKIYLMNTENFSYYDFILLVLIFVLYIKGFIF